MSILVQFVHQESADVYLDDKGCQYQHHSLKEHLHFHPTNQSISAQIALILNKNMYAQTKLILKEFNESTL